MLNTTNKIYIGKVEAFEIAQERGINKLPRKGHEIITAYPKYLMRQDEVIGKDKQGYYLGEI